MKDENQTRKRGGTGFFRIRNLGQNSAIGRVMRRPAKFLRQMSLKTRVVLLVVAMLVAGIWALALSVTLALQRDLTEMQSASLSAEIVSVAADLDHDVKLQIDVLVRLAASLTPEIRPIRRSLITLLINSPIPA